ncbi:hypothetical protein E0Z10_g3928 [Xylaria hypoxylon]|uniref:Isochorismatase-like domain-containing protein n=1 Tax=Xylaria hypoxylon TaxID=37992 RepID=A0A4Z0YLU6_9PEZI|nr:hypothetical protein E0Z10_g3928 [Xylaria hypoxylon]
MAKTAFILLDIQVGVVEMLKGIVDTDQYLAKVSSTLAAARKAGIPVVQVTTGYRPSYVDASPRNMMTVHVKSSGGFKETDASTQLHPALAEAAADDIHIRKRRVSALYGTDLDLVLRSLGIEKIVVAGVSTSGAVLSTVIQAFDMDYEITILADLCADTPAEVHETLLGKVLSKRASVVNAEEWVASLES